MSIHDYILVLLYSLIFLFGMMGNILIITFFGYRMKKLASYRLFIIHLAIADCVCSLIVPVLYTYETISIEWTIGEASCKFLHIIPSVTITVSAWILCGIAYERYKAIVHPHQRRLRPTVIHMYCVGLWILSSIAYAPHLIKLQIGKGKCRLKWENSSEALATTIGHFSIQNAIPLITMSFFFHHMYRASREHSRVPVQALLISVLTFAFCSMPQAMFYIIVLCLHFYRPGFRTYEIDVKIYTWLLVLLYANCVVNCFIYAGKFKEFRNYIKTFVKRRDKNGKDGEENIVELLRNK